MMSCDGWTSESTGHWGRYGSWVQIMPDDVGGSFRKRLKRVMGHHDREMEREYDEMWNNEAGMNMPEARSEKNFAEEKAEGLIESFLYALHNAVWQMTYEKQKTWAQLSDGDFKLILQNAFMDCGMKLMMSNPKIVRYVNEIALYAFDDFRMNLPKTNSLRRSQIRSYQQDLRNLGD